MYGKNKINCSICNSEFDPAKWEGFYERFAVVKQVGSPEQENNQFGIWEEHEEYGFLCKTCFEKYIVPIQEIYYKKGRNEMPNEEIMNNLNKIAIEINKLKAVVNGGS